MPNAYEILYPDERSSCVVFSSPHSGRDYITSFRGRSNLNARALRSSEDAFVDELFRSVPQFGAPLLKALAPRAFVDLNRSPDELDPALIEGVKRTGHNPRVVSGLGVIPRVVANAQPIYRGKLPSKEAQTRIETYWRPYHAALKTLLDHAFDLHGRAILIDCHSMPHEAMDEINASGGKRPNVVLGDRFGAASSPAITDMIEEAFASAGFFVARNTPFAGAYITQTYGRPSHQRHAVQIEIDRSLYMDERTIRPNPSFAEIQERLETVAAQISGFGSQQIPLAAE